MTDSHNTRQPITRAEFAYFASGIASRAAEWCGCCLSPFKSVTEPMTQDAIDRFTDHIKGYLEMIKLAKKIAELEKVMRGPYER